MSLNETLLAIKREYSKDEKFKLFLKHLDNVESELRAERKKNTELLKKFNELQSEINNLKLVTDQLQEELDLHKATGVHPKFVTVKSHTKMTKKKVEYEKLFWEKYHECEELKKQIKTLEDNSYHNGIEKDLI